MQRRDPLGVVQAQPRALARPRDAVRALAGEQRPQPILRDPRAGIAQRDHAPAPVRVELHLRVALLPGRPDRVGHQRQQHLREQGLAPLERQVLHVRRIGEPHPRQVRQGLRLVGHPLAHLRQVEALLPREGLLVQLLRQLRLPRQPQHLVEQPLLVGQVAGEIVLQPTLAQAALEHPLHRHRVRQALPHPEHRLRERVALLLLLARQRTQHDQVALRQRRHRHAVLARAERQLRRLARVLRQREEQVLLDLLLPQQPLARLIGIQQLPCAQEHHRLREAPELHREPLLVLVHPVISFAHSSAHITWAFSLTGRGRGSSPASLANAGVFDKGLGENGSGSGEFFRIGPSLHRESGV